MKKILTTLMFLAAFGQSVQAAEAQNEATKFEAEYLKAKKMENIKPILNGIAGYFTITGLLKLGGLALAHPIAATSVGAVALIYALLKRSKKEEVPTIIGKPDDTLSEMVKFLELLKKKPELRRKFYALLSEKKNVREESQEETPREESVQERYYDSDEDYDYYRVPRRRRMHPRGRGRRYHEMRVEEEE